jgi:hypothetical protein
MARYEPVPPISFLYFQLSYFFPISSTFYYCITYFCFATMLFYKIYEYQRSKDATTRPNVPFGTGGHKSLNLDISLMHRNFKVYVKVSKVN